MSVRPTSVPEPKFRIAICGAGIGGFILAITIGKYAPSIPIDIYEAHDSIETAGVGINLWKQAHEVLIDLELFEDFKEIFTDFSSSAGPNIRRSDMPQGGYRWYQRPGPANSLHRQQMVAILERHIPASCTIYLKKRLVNYTEPQEEDSPSSLPICLEFADGTAAATDVLIGADGIRSGVRKTLFEMAASEDIRDQTTDLKECIDATFTGMSAYRFLVPTEKLRKESPENRSLEEMSIYCGKGRYLITYPIAQATLINVVVIVGDPNLAGTRYDGRWVTNATHDEVAGLLDDFEPDVKAVVKLCENPTKWAIHELKPLPFCVRKRVALIGDASHAMTPYYGAGAGQAIDDAYVLGRLIAHPLMTPSLIPNALRIYEEIRLPFAHTLADLSLSNGWMHMFMQPGYYDGTKREEDLDERGISTYERDGMENIKQEVLQHWKWIDDSSSGIQTWKEAKLKLQTLVGQPAK